MIKSFFSNTFFQTLSLLSLPNILSLTHTYTCSEECTASYTVCERCTASYPVCEKIECYIVRAMVSFIFRLARSNLAL